MKTILTVVCICLLGLNLMAESSEKKYEKNFPKEGVEELVITNQEGQINVEQTEGNEIQVVVNMKVIAKSKAKADEILEYIQIADNAKGKYINLTTEVGKDMTFQQLLSGVSVQVDYQVNIPKGIKLRLISTNGNVFLDRFEGEINADVRTGNFKANSIKGEEFYIKQNKGNFEVEDIAFLNGDFKDCNIRVESGADVRLVTQGGTGKLQTIDKLNIRSSGGEMKIGEVEDFSGSSSSTKYEVQDLGNTMDMDMKWGEMNIRNIHFNFSEIRLKGSYTKFGLTFMEDAGYHLELKCNKALMNKVDLPRGMKLESRPTTEKNMVIGTKFIGNVKYSAKVFLDVYNGTLFIQ